MEIYFTSGADNMLYITMRNYKSDFITNPTTISVLPANMEI